MSKTSPSHSVRRYVNVIEHKPSTDKSRPKAVSYSASRTKKAKAARRSIQTSKLESVTDRSGRSNVIVKSSGKVFVTSRKPGRISPTGKSLVSVARTKRTSSRKSPVSITPGKSSLVKKESAGISPVKTRSAVADERLKRKKPLTLEKTMQTVIKERTTATITDTESRIDNSVNINGDNNIYVEGDYKPAKTYKTYSHLHRSTHRIHYMTDHRWCGCGRFHLVRWRPSSCARLVYFNNGLHFGISYMYPRYHRKYLFVSVGGHWPFHYRYRRYYRYGCHPYRWHGARPEHYPSVEKKYVTYNTYNYYNEPAQPQYDDSDYNSYSQLDNYVENREQLRQQQDEQVEVEDEPAEETKTDILFENAVNAFEDGNYEAAIASLEQARELAPEDEVLPFALSQSLFATGQYTSSAVLLREIFDNMPRDRETLFYPRGLYREEKLLESQIDTLNDKTENDPFNGDLNLLLAYHLLGTGRFDEVEEPLKRAELDKQNSVAVAIMKDLLEKSLENVYNDMEAETEN